MVNVSTVGGLDRPAGLEHLTLECLKLQNKTYMHSAAHIMLALSAYIMAFLTQHTPQATKMLPGALSCCRCSSNTAAIMHSQALPCLPAWVAGVLTPRGSCQTTQVLWLLMLSARL